MTQYFYDFLEKNIKKYFSIRLLSLHQSCAPTHIYNVAMANVIDKFWLNNIFFLFFCRLRSWRWTIYTLVPKRAFQRARSAHLHRRNYFGPRAFTLGKCPEHKLLKIQNRVVCHLRPPTCHTCSTRAYWVEIGSHEISHPAFHPPIWWILTRRWLKIKLIFTPHSYLCVQLVVCVPKFFAVCWNVN